MKLRIYKSVDLNTLLQIINVIIPIITLVGYVMLGSNKYINEYTLLLVWIFSFVNCFILLIEKKKSDRFVLLLMFNVIIFHMGRVASLLYFPFTYRLLRNNLTAKDLNHALAFTICCVIAIFWGLRAATRRAGSREAVFNKQRFVEPGIAVVLACTALLYTAAQRFGLLAGAISGYLYSFIQIQSVFLCVLVYFGCHYHRLPKRYINIVAVLGVAYFALETAVGNRSGIYTLAILVLVVAATLKPRVRISRKLIVLGIGLSLLGIVTFSVATDLRNNYWQSGGVDTHLMARVIEGVESAQSRSLGSMLAPLLSRMGFLDYSTDLIANRKQYRKIINLSYYCKSFVDDLTPGFEIFNVSRASNVAMYAYNSPYVPDTHALAKLRYHSDMFTVFGEYYVLFGPYIAFIILLVLSFLFKKLYYLVGSKTRFLYYLYKAFVLSIFYSWLNSFGMDWFAVRLVMLFALLLLASNFYRMKLLTKVPE